jgi:hypothetical protein
MHVLEDLLSDWSGKEYVNTVVEFFKATLEGKDYRKAREELKKALEKKQKMRHIIRNEKMKITDAAF